MSAKFNVLQEGFTEQEIAWVWEMAIKVQGMDPKNIRKDKYGAFIEFDKYGDTSSEENTGWEIDHIIPKARGGSDSLNNLQPLHWLNNRRKSDGNGRDFSPVVAKQ